MPRGLARLAIGFVAVLAPLAFPMPAPTLKPSPSPTLSPAPSPTPSPPVTGDLAVTKTDPQGNTVTVPGAAFNVHQGSASGQVVAALKTDASGTATAAGLTPGIYCVEETAAPPGFQVAPTYTPSACTLVNPDPGHDHPATISVADQLAAAPTPSVGELRIVTVDPSGAITAVAGATFNVHVGTGTGAVIAALTTDATGVVVLANLNPATYCVEETAAPAGYQTAPTYSPNACIAVAADQTQGRLPTTVSVTNPPAATPTPSPDQAQASPSPSPNHSSPSALAATGGGGGFGRGLLANLMVGIGLLLLAGGAGMIVVALRRRRAAPTW